MYLESGEKGAAAEISMSSKKPCRNQSKTFSTGGDFYLD